MNVDEYFSHSAMNVSLLSAIDKSPANFAWRKENRQVDTDALRIGRICHLAALELDRFSKEVIVFRGVRRGKKWDEFQAQNSDRLIVSESEYATAVGVSMALGSHPVAGPLLNGGEYEQSCIWAHPSGRECKVRFDLVDVDRELIVDLKTTRDASNDSFGRSAHSYLYNARAAFYCDAYEQTHGHTPRYVLIAVEKVPPYHIGCYELDPEDLETGRAKYERWLATLDQCERTNRWPGLNNDELVDLRMPPWSRDEVVLDIGGESVAV